MKHRATALLFIICIGAMLFFALCPNRHGERLHELPRPIGRWLNEHDDFANFAAFAVLASLAFALPGHDGRASNPRGMANLADVVSQPGVRFGLLLAFVAALEAAQLAIPGRFSEFRDVATGWAGVFCAWLARAAINRLIIFDIPTPPISTFPPLTDLSPSQNYRQILGLRFFTGTAQEAVQAGLRGGLVVVPSAPVLLGMVDNAANREALLGSDLAITDSGLMILLWGLLTHEYLTRVSGLEYLKLLLDEPSLREPRAALWVMPDAAKMETNVAWLNTQGLPTARDDCYLAPRYDAGAIIDPVLLEIIKRRRPAHIILAIGGGVQERLGYYLKTHADYRPGIHCIGAAIGFLSGDQVNIPPWADRYFLGWLFRCFSAPGQFVPRYWKARKLIALIFKYRERLPLLQASAE